MSPKLKKIKILKKHYYCENEMDKQAILTIHKGGDSTKSLFVTNKNLDKLKNIFFGNHKKIDAAGGLVLNPRGENLFRKRLGY